MGLRKELKFGELTVTYFKILGLHSNTLYRSTVARVACYEDKAARDKDETGYKKIIPVVLPTIDTTRDSAYMLLKTMPPFDGAESVMEEN
jgi:hypothetical protein